MTVQDHRGRNVCAQCEGQHAGVWQDERPPRTGRSRDGKGLPACRSDFGLSVTGEGYGLLETKGGEVSDYPRRTRFNGWNMKPKNKVNKIWHSLLYGNF